MESEVVALDGVKFLSLARSRKDFSTIDGVIREVIVGKLLVNTQTESPPPPQPAAAANADTTTHQETSCKSSAVPLIPFVASVQYAVLEDESDMVYGLIQSVTRRMGFAVDNEHTRSQSQPLPEYISSWKNESTQADKLAEFSKFRKEIMASLPIITQEKDDDEDSLLEKWDTITSLRKSGEKSSKRRVKKGVKTQ